MGAAAGGGAWTATGRTGGTTLCGALSSPPLRGRAGGGRELGMSSRPPVCGGEGKCLRAVAGRWGKLRVGGKYIKSQPAGGGLGGGKNKKGQRVGGVVRKYIIGRRAVVWRGGSCQERVLLHNGSLRRRKHINQKAGGGAWTATKRDRRATLCGALSSPSPAWSCGGGRELGCHPSPPVVRRGGQVPPCGGRALGKIACRWQIHKKSAGGRRGAEIHNRTASGRRKSRARVG